MDNVLERSNLIELLIELRKVKESTYLIYKKENTLFNGWDYSYFYRDNEKYIVSITYPFRGFKIPFKFEESRNKQSVFKGDNFEIIESKFDYKNNEFNFLNLIINDTSKVARDMSYNTMLCVIDELIDFNNRKILFNTKSNQRLVIINRWLKYIRNNDDKALIPQAIACLYFLNMLYKKDKSTKLRLIDNLLCIEYKGRILKRVYPYEYPIFSLHLNSKNRFILGMKLDIGGVSIYDLLNKELSNVLDKYTYNETRKIIIQRFGDEFTSKLDWSIPYKIKLDINECTINEDDEDVEIEDEFSKREIEELEEALKDEGKAMTFEEYKKWVEEIQEGKDE